MTIPDLLDKLKNFSEKEKIQLYKETMFFQDRRLHSIAELIEKTDLNIIGKREVSYILSMPSYDNKYYSIKNAINQMRAFRTTEKPMLKKLDLLDNNRVSGIKILEDEGELESNLNLKENIKWAAITQILFPLEETPDVFLSPIFEAKKYFEEKGFI